MFKLFNSHLHLHPIVTLSIKDHTIHAITKQKVNRSITKTTAISGIMSVNNIRLDNNIKPNNMSQPCLQVKGNCILINIIPRRQTFILML